MTVGDCCSTTIVVTERDTGVRDAARLMREHHVGDVVVIERENGLVRPIGIVTDRDLTIQVLACDGAPNGLTVGELIRDEVFVAGIDDDIRETLQRMRDRGIRRAPVVDADGGLCGILTLDDMLAATATTMRDMAQLVQRELQAESQRV
jgi:CBS domain-containing protein